MLASLCRNHFVVIGVGKVGYQVIKHLLELRESVVAIEMASGSPLLGELFDKGVPVIQGNARRARSWNRRACARRGPSSSRPATT